MTPTPLSTRAPVRHVATLLAALAATACSDLGVGPFGGGDGRSTEQAEFCLDSGFQIVQSGVRKDGIPALSNPAFVNPGQPGTETLTPADPVVGIVLDDEALAIPLSIMRWHEIVNLDRTGVRVAVTYCPLTGTAIAFDRLGVGGAELGVSGLLVENNLIMYDRTTDQSLFAQMLGSAMCGRLKGRELTRLPVIVTSWQGWRSLHPDSKVASTATGWDRDYAANPYLDYDRLDAPPLFITELSQDDRRLPKERVLGIPSESGPGLAIPFLELEAHDRATLSLEVDGRPLTVLWDRSLEVAAAFAPQPEWADGFEPGSSEAPTWTAVEDGFVDSVTGSVWTVEGLAVSGPALGSRLRPVHDALVAYWFAWAAFHRGTGILTEF